ncbi:hypothetical protein DQ04_02951130 [Trypanosoma grayi]|uniref:hypothetical protein n=1 Tax=Trypanosoma grayi TaxID=71804 RepID=UPI0004F4597E|nr:hypothetical protein DQ04_02951130 [Trypanosoma grayi]KEG11135.1 hypothetical protein DQ04_02951130 [Trypanosoma grayi]
MARVESSSEPQRIAVAIKEAVLACSYEHTEMALNECLVCKLHLVECCLDCRVKGRSEADCRVVRGVCDHTFHEHCIESWYRQRRDCPACFKEWVLAAYVERA